jgi:hypothetical protein
MCIVYLDTGALYIDLVAYHVNMGIEKKKTKKFFFFFGEKRRIGCSMIYIHENGRRMKEEDEVSSRRNT